MRTKVRLERVLAVWVRSWLSFVLAVGLIGLFWWLCYWLTATFAHGYLNYFRYGAWGAGIIGVLMLVFNEWLVVISLGAKRIYVREENPKLWDAVLRATPMLAKPCPRIYLIPDDGMNAMAFGWGIPYFSAVAATKGIISGLTDEELSAVMAHEAGHIVNKDILVSTALTISVMMMAFTGWLLLRISPYGGSSDDDDRKGSGWALIVALLIGVLLYLVGRGLAVVLQMFVSRQREYAADATSARIMGSGRPLVSALKKVCRRPHIASAATAAAFGFLCTADPNPDDLLSTHPSLDNRIVALLDLED